MSGVQVPTVAKKALVGDGGKRLIIENTIYFRTLSTNGTPSSAAILARDLRALMDVCFDNREADIGRFLRRLVGSSDAASLLQQLVPPQTPDRPAGARALLDDGRARFVEAVRTNEVEGDAEKVKSFLTLEVALVLDPPRAERPRLGDFLNTSLSANPRLNGWPMWIDSRNFPEQANRPYMFDQGWNSLVLSRGGFSPHFDFFRLEPRGAFYLWRVMQEDLVGQADPGSLLDPFLMVYRVAEAVVVGLLMARALEWGDDAVARFAFRWTNLKGRTLSAWANPLRFMHAGGTSRTEEVVTEIEVPANTATTAVAPFIEQAMEPLLATFDGYALPSEVYEDLCRRLVERRMSG